jgi:serine/threonine protein kinase
VSVENGLEKTKETQMLNSREASELISKSMLGSLTHDEQAIVNQHLQNDPAARAFAELSQAINQSVIDVGASATDPAGPGLSDEAKSRMKDSVLSAISNSRIQLPVDNDALKTLDQKTDDTADEIGPDGSQPANPSTSFELATPEDPKSNRRESKSRFTLLRELGSGGLGRVWLARDEKLNRNVALKEMNQTALQLPQAWKRFNREAEITGQLEHPNVVSLYQYGNESKSSEPFYAMRFVGKRTLADAINEYHEQCKTSRGNALSLHRLVTAFLDVCQAVAYAHSRGVIHRDLKPENVALDNYGQTIVLDWGLAKITDDAELGVRLSGDNNLSDEMLAQTVDGEVIGTPLYMAPEQAAGRLDEIDRQTDVYGLGGILFAILTGEAPHNKTHSTTAGSKVGVKDMLNAIAENETVGPREFRSSVPLELDRICREAMAVKKYARYQSVVDLSSDVERWMVDQGSRQSKYENLRLEGRELRNNVQSVVRDLETNVRFMSKLPPIQELIRVENEEDFGIWRERLSTIFSGLLNAKSDFRSVIYSRIDGDQFTEMVRVERHSKVHSNIRAIPRSRLRSGKIGEFAKATIVHEPDEVHTSLSCSPLCSAAEKPRKGDRMSIVAGVPVFDDQTEELFGVVLVECDLERVLLEQLNRRFSAKNIVVACDTYQVVVHSNEQDGVIEENTGRELLDILPQFESAHQALQSKLEFIDETDRTIYGTRLWLVKHKHGLMFMLNQ